MASQRSINIIKQAITRLYPRELAENSWDNTGLLLECPPPPPTSSNKSSSSDALLSILLTIDLTKAVVSEAISKNASFIVAYHPFIFRGLKSITQTDSQQQSLLRLVQAGISVYCPHTAIDAAVGGVNDWLADGVSKGRQFEESRNVLTPPGTENVKGHEEAGMGRLVKLKEPVELPVLIERIKKHLGIKHLQIALTEAHRDAFAKVSSIAICAGSGGSVLKGAKADIHFTGELSHHELLHLVESGTSCIVCGHSNTERGFLKNVLQKQLKEEIDSILKEELLQNGDDEGNDNLPKECQVIVSEKDKDPLEFA